MSQFGEIYANGQSWLSNSVKAAVMGRVKPASRGRVIPAIFEGVGSII
jgi:hypothetical protein